MRIPNLYKDLLNLPGIAGYEKKVRDYMIDYMKQFPNYEIKRDNLGSVFAYKKSNTPNAQKVMVAGHMDEVGFMVVDITSDGYLKLVGIGGLVPEVFISQVMNVYTESEVIKGVIGAIPPHLKKGQANKIDDLRLDVGASSKDEVLSFGISVGNMVLFDNPFFYTKNKKRLISKAIDNRYGCGLALEIIKEFNNINLPFDLIVGATVQEEVGLRGAETAVNLIQPDLFFALDASPIKDNSDNAGAYLGKGFLIRIFDPRNVINEPMLEYIEKLSQVKKLKPQHFVSAGGTDAAKTLDMHAGIPSTTIGLPARYIHATAAMMDLDDLKECRRAIFTILKDLNNEKILNIKGAN